jgi:DNA-binding SARP family transcriptional activator
MAALDPTGAPGRLWRQLFERFPLGIVVVDPLGKPIVWNRALESMVGDHPVAATAPIAFCCRLLGCGDPGGPLADGCLTKLALERGRQITDVHIDLRGRGVPLGVWVTATPLEDHGPRVMLLLRPEEPAAGQLAPAAQPVLWLYLLGRTRVELDHVTVGWDWHERRPGQILKYLACERTRIVPADEIAESIWPNADARTLSTVRYFVHALRNYLEPERPRGARPSFIVTHGSGYSLNRGRVWIDADAFEEGVRAGLAAANARDRAAEELLERALALYRGNFLADLPYAVWAFNERERLMTLAASGLRALADIRLARGDLSGAMPHVARIAEMQPLDLDAQRETIALSLRRGRRSEAVRRYAALRMRTLREFGEGPGFDLAELMDQLNARADKSLG